MGLQVRVLQLTARQVSQMGLEVSEAPPERYVEYTNTRTGETMDVPVGVHPAFNYRPGLRRESLARALMDKADVAEPRTAARMLADGADQWAPLVQVEFNDFVGRYTGGERRTVGQRRVVGAFSSDQVDALLGAGQLRGAGARGTIHVDMTKLRSMLGGGQHAPGPATDAGAALVAQLPTLLRQVGEAWLDGHHVVLLCTSPPIRNAW